MNILSGILPGFPETEQKKEETAVVPELKKGGFIMRKRYGAFGTKEKAEAKKEELEKQGIKTEIKEIKVRNQPRWTPEEC